MGKMSAELRKLFERDIKKLSEELKQIPESLLWKSPEGVTNSCGILAQHLAGNLNYYIGTCLGENDYIRHRDLEFSNSGRSKKDLIADIEEVRDTVSSVLETIDAGQLSEPSPEEFPFDHTVSQSLMHLYGHLNYHLGQFNYLRRIVSGK